MVDKTKIEFKVHGYSLTKDKIIINSEAFHHFKYCLICIPGAVDMPSEQRLCPEGLSYYNRMQGD